MLPVLAAAGGIAARGAAAAATRVGGSLVAGIAGAGRAAATGLVRGAAAEVGSTLVSSFDNNRRERGRREDIIDAEYTVVDDGGRGGRGDDANREQGPGQQIVPVQQSQPRQDIVPVQEQNTLPAIPDQIEVVPVEGEGQEPDQSPAERLLDVLDRIDDNTARTASSVERLLDAQEDRPLEGPVDDPNDPNDGASGTDTGKEQKGPFAKIFKSLKGFLNKMVLLFAAAGLVVGGILAGGAGDLFEKLKDGFDRIVKALAPILEMLFETIMPIVFDVMGKLVDMFVLIVEALAPVLKVIIETVVPPLLKTFGLLVEIFTNIIEFVSPILPFLAEAVGEAFSAVMAVVNGVLEFLTDPIGYIKDGLSYIADGGDRIIAGMADMINGVIEFFADIVSKFSDSAAEGLRSTRVEFGDSARERMAQREQERQDRERARNGDQPAEEVAAEEAAQQTAPVDIPPQEVERLQESQQQTTRQATNNRRRGRGQPATREETNAGPSTDLPESDGTKVDPVREVVTIIQSKDAKIKDGVVTIVKGTGRAKRRVPLKANDFEGLGYTEQDVTAAMAALGATPSQVSPGTFEVAAPVAMEEGGAQQQTGQTMAEASTETQQATETAQAASSGGANINAPMQATNVQNINSSTSTGVIYTGERDSLGGRSRILPGVA